MKRRGLKSLFRDEWLVFDEHGNEITTLRVSFNPFFYRPGVAIHADHEVLDDLMILATGCQISAIEGRQS